VATICLDHVIQALDTASPGICGPDRVGIVA
jgi:hypothetical protein